MKRGFLPVLVTALFFCVRPPLLPAQAADSGGALPESANGEDTAVESFATETIVITAAAESLKAGASAATARVDADMIAASGAESAADALKLLPGVHLNTNGTRSSIGSVSLRGSRSNQVLILIDGVPMLDPAGSGGYDLSKIPADTIECIETVKGGGSALYGDGAYAGAINIITKSGESGRSGHVRYFFNSQEGHELKGGFSLGSKTVPGLSGHFSASILYNPYDLKIVGGDTITDAVLGYAQWGVSRITGRYEIRYRSFFNETYNVEQIGNRLSSLSQSNTLSWSIGNPGEKCRDYTGQFALNFYNLQWTPAGAGFTDENFSSVLLLKNSASFAASGDRWALNASVGGDLKTELLNAYFAGFLHRTTVSPTAAVSVAFSDRRGRPVGVFDAGSRLDVMAGDRTLVFPSVWGGFSFYFDREKRYGVKTSAGNGFRAPTMSELYYSYGSVTAAPDLKAEKAAHLDVSFFFRILDSMELSAGWFYRHETDTVYFDNNTFRNLPAADFNGAEVSFLGAFLLGKDSIVDLNLQYELNYGFYNDGTPFDLNHRHIFRSLLSYRYGEWFSAYVRTDVYSGFADIKPFTDLSAGLMGSYKGFFLELGIKNMLDLELRYHNYTSVVPRSWSCGIGYRAGLR